MHPRIILHLDSEPPYQEKLVESNIQIQQEIIEVEPLLNNANIRSYHHLMDINTEPDYSLQYFTAPQIASIYKFPSGSTGKNQVVGIIELGGGFNIADIQAYYKNLGYTSVPNIISVSVDGAVNNPSDISNSYEVVLDIEIIAGIAPDAKIVVYFAPNTTKGFYNAISAAINDTVNKPTAISISWGSPESNWSTNNMTLFDNLFASASAKNINIFAASGDNNSSDGLVGLNVDFPSSSPNIISCGGTTLTLNGSTRKEIAWSSGGGGFSKFFGIPSYQSNISNISIVQKRGTPDICGNADPSTGYRIFINGTYNIIGGTSAVSPLWAGLILLLQEKVGPIKNLHNLLYTHVSNSCFDILTGSNGAYSSIIGWDACTGIGSIDGSALLGILTGSPGPSPNPGPIGTPYTGILYGPTQSVVVPNGTYYYSKVNGVHSGYLVGPLTSEFYLYLFKWNGFSWSNVATGSNATNIQTISYNGTPGYYAWLIYDNIGSGSFTVYINTP